MTMSTSLPSRYFLTSSDDNSLISLLMKGMFGKFLLCVFSDVYKRQINLYAFNSNGNRGIACGLNNLQKISDGEPLGGKSRAEDDFATEDDDDYLS